MMTPFEMQVPAPVADFIHRRRKAGLSSLSVWFWLFSIGFLISLDSFAVSLEQLQNDKTLTPRRFAKYFSGFEYKYHSEVQPLQSFLVNHSGDCDDYAILADRVLRPKGYETHLIYIHMGDSIAHTVCYIAQEKGYLDYNNRGYFVTIQRSGGTLAEIAREVAKSFDTDWNFVSEFVYTEGRQHFIANLKNPLRPAFTRSAIASSSEKVLPAGGRK